MEDRIDKSGFDGRGAVEVYAATATASGLRFYAKTGMKINRAYTPTAMLKRASQITGKTFKRGQYELAAAELKAWAEREAARIRASQ